MTEKLSKTSVQLSPEIIEWLDKWPDVKRSEALRLILERYEYLVSSLKGVEELALQYAPILAPALQEFRSDNFRAVARALPAIVGSYIQENQDVEWAGRHSNPPLETAELHRRLGSMNALERIHLLDCIVAQRDWEHEPAEDKGSKGRKR
jgi:hypothetical protein